MFPAIVLEKSERGVAADTRQLDETQLPDEEVTVAVAYSGLNYKDGMVIKGLGNLVKEYPHVPGVDLVGTVASSRNPRWTEGDVAIATGWRIGEAHWGGYAGRCRLRGDWLVGLPPGMTPKQAMALGTAGLTAMLATMALEEHGLEPGGEHRVLVTGASGGVGSAAVALLSALGYEVAAGTGRPENEEYLRSLGAGRIVSRRRLASLPKGPLGAQRWAGCIDTVGGDTLARVLSETVYGGPVAAVGLAGGSQLTGSVIPFLLRGVNLLGIDSVMCPTPRRQEAWSRLASAMPADKLEAMTTVAGLGAVPGLADQILAGQVRGRVVVDVTA